MGILDSTPLSGFFYNPKDDKKKAEQALNQGNEAYDQLVTPTYQPVDYQGPEAAADIRVNPVAIDRVGPSAMGDVAVDPGYKASQLAQLSALEQLRDQGGYNAQDEANLARIANEEALREKSQRDTTLQQAQARGTGGSGMSLLAMLQANQDAANRQSQRDLDVAGAGQARALQAGNSAASLAGNMGAQDFNQQSQIAQAQDAAAKFNAQMTNQGNQFNAGQDFNAQNANMQKNQGVNNARATAQQSSQNMNRFTMPQSQYQNQLAKAQGKANVGKNASDYYQGQMNEARKAQGGLWGGALENGMKAASMFGGAAGGGSGAGGQGGEVYNNSKAGMANSGNDSVGEMSSDYNYDSYPKNYVEQNNNSSNYQPYPGYAYGGKIPGEPSIQGDSFANDRVQANLSPGEVVVPRSMTHAAPKKIGQYVKHAPDAEKQARIKALKAMKGRK